MFLGSPLLPRLEDIISISLLDLFFIKLIFVSWLFQFNTKIVKNFISSFQIEMKDYELNSRFTKACRRDIEVHCRKDVTSSAEWVFRSMLCLQILFFYSTSFISVLAYIFDFFCIRLRGVLLLCRVVKCLSEKIRNHKLSDGRSIPVSKKCVAEVTVEKLQMVIN